MASRNERLPRFSVYQLGRGDEPTTVVGSNFPAVAFSMTTGSSLGVKDGINCQQLTLAPTPNSQTGRRRMKRQEQRSSTVLGVGQASVVWELGVCLVLPIHARQQL